MTEVLSQDEIDQLLTAINAGDTEPEVFKPAADTRKIKIYDFKRPDKFSKEQIRTVSIMHETFARLTTTALSAQLRAMVHVHVASVDQLTYEEFIRSIPTPTTLAVINMDPLKGNAILEIDPAITFSIIERLFGGPGEGTKSQHELTDIESAVMEGIVVRILGNMREAWAQVIDLRPRLGQIDTNPQFAQIVPPTEMVVLVTLETKIGEVEGMMNFCIPYLTIEPIIGKLSTQFWFSSVHRGTTPENLNLLKEKLANVDVSVIAEIGSIQVPIRDVLGLRAGDVVRLNNVRAGDAFSLNIGNKTKFLCRPGIIGKKVAVQIIKKTEELEKEEFEELTAEGEEAL
ncbi:flagellar motor switch protein FliM [Treponema primitia ZAS-2]|uniref:Flagellar motor switch protein FliM n=1 Tax=Treponema primitia (strain ATCC BAA-887 / DSM 12427 / ZAS-2) TaxID=545694 RepID=F5YPT9_TREPZ|nr:flagellar motor switch protein FliM [Treponema primitia]AEF85911.1 flagellar motor switch protein FliM [Treponema primitia ZAS-2]